MDLPRAGEVILPFIAAKIEASLALPWSNKWILSLKYKLSIFPGPDILFVNKIEHVERAFVSQNTINFTNDSSAD